MVFSRKTGITSATSVLTSWLHAVAIAEAVALVLIGWISDA